MDFGFGFPSLDLFLQFPHISSAALLISKDWEDSSKVASGNSCLILSYSASACCILFFVMLERALLFASSAAYSRACAARGASINQGRYLFSAFRKGSE